MVSLFVYDFSFLKGQSSYLNFKFNRQIEILGIDIASGIKSNALKFKAKEIYVRDKKNIYIFQKI